MALLEMGVKMASILSLLIVAYTRVGFSLQMCI